VALIHRRAKARRIVYPGRNDPVPAARRLTARGARLPAGAASPRPLGV